MLKSKLKLVAFFGAALVVAMIASHLVTGGTPCNRQVYHLEP